MDSTQDRPQPGAGDICPDLGGPEITGPIEITWPDGLEALQRISQAANRCATYLQDIRHVLGQISSTSGQMADAMQRIHDGMGAMQDDIAYAADTLSYIADCACRGLSAQIEAAERPLLTWEGHWIITPDVPRSIVGFAEILAPIYIRRLEITYAGELKAVMCTICACARISHDPWWISGRILWPQRIKNEPPKYIMLQPGLQTIIDNLMIYVDAHDEIIGWQSDMPPTMSNMNFHVRLTYDRLDGLRQPALRRA